MLLPWYGSSLDDFSSLGKEREIQMPIQIPFERATKFTQINILGPNGIVKVSIPIKKHLKGSHISEIKIDYIQKWQNQHWRTLQSCYGRSPFFEYYKEELRPLFYQSPEYLIEFTVPILKWICKQYFPEKYFSVILAQNLETLQPIGLLPLSDNEDKGCKESSQTYTQVFGQEFVSGLSVLDALFCAGPNFGMCKTI